MNISSMPIYKALFGDSKTSQSQLICNVKICNKRRYISEVLDGTLYLTIRIGDTVKYHNTDVFSILGNKEETNGK